MEGAKNSFVNHIYSNLPGYLNTIILTSLILMGSHKLHKGLKDYGEYIGSFGVHNGLITSKLEDIEYDLNKFSVKLDDGLNKIYKNLDESDNRLKNINAQSRIIEEKTGLILKMLKENHGV